VCLCRFDLRFGWQARGKIRQRRLLRFGHNREQTQVVADGRCLRQRTQPRRPPREHVRAIGNADARYRTLRQRFDLTGFQDALSHAAHATGIAEAKSRRPGRLACVPKPQEASGIPT